MFRIEPELPAAAFKTYAIRSPGRPANCAEVACEAFLYGWQTIVPADGDLAYYIRHASGRGFTETRSEDGLAVFTFEAGQQCFAASEHRAPAEGRERFIERGGDWRGNPLGNSREHNADTWLDSFANHQIRLAEAKQRG